MTRHSLPADHVTLLLMRHGKSDWKAGAADDSGRPLNRRGKKASALIGGWLRKQGLVPDSIIVSPAVRARETARIVADAAGCPAERLTLDERLYLTGVAQHLEVLQDCAPQAGTLLLIGHNPGLEELLDALCKDPPATPKNGKMMPTAAVAVLHVPQPLNSLQPGQALLRELVRPRELAD